ncbi:unnamed protein product [Chrysodeixis includens]|uniref:Uncharacterized protein n=1 Tax=Chrysodeixis includens TaxID=689277 RepID=A0A9P0C4Z0_CHRIL|nr:unnamed protein product [Chrysodeixis includens]
MAKLMIFVLLSVVCGVAYSKHVHPRNIMMQAEEELELQENPIPTDIDGMPIEVITHLKPSRFVPVNNVLFFTHYPPCEEGFTRDILGVCREVWD